MQPFFISTVLLKILRSNCKQTSTQSFLKWCCLANRISEVPARAVKQHQVAQHRRRFALTRVRQSNKTPPASPPYRATSNSPTRRESPPPPDIKFLFPPS